MTIASSHPEPAQFNSLLAGTLSEAEVQAITAHLDDCTTCAERLQATASGEMPVEQLLRGLESEQPQRDSALWPALQSAAGMATNASENRVMDNATGATPLGSETPTQTLAPIKRAQPGDDFLRDLPFLEPADDPAYLGSLHHFLIARVIGRGGMGTVLEGFDTHLRRRVAIKVLNPELQGNEVARQRFCREGRAAAAISHEHVVPMYHVSRGNDDGIAYLVMQLVEGETLEGRMRSRQPLPAADVARIGMQIAAGLAAAHRREMVHRDIKPANILLEAETDRVKLTDFGLARATDDVRLTVSGMVTGTPLYMSPEQTLGETADERGDLFSLGAVMYEMATGRPPFEAPTAIGVMKRIVEQTPKPPAKVNPEIPPRLSEIIMQLLAKSPVERPGSAVAVAGALATLLTDYGPISPLQVPAIGPEQLAQPSGTYCRTRRRWAVAGWIAGAVGTTALLVAVALMWIPRADAFKGPYFPSVPLANNPGTVWSTDFSPDGKRVAAAVGDGSVSIWDADEAKLMTRFNAHRGIVWNARFHDARPLLITSGDDGSVRVWDTERFELLHAWELKSTVRGIAISPDGRRLAAGCRGGMIHMLDLEKFEALETQSQAGAIYGVAYSPDGRWLATVGSDTVVRLWDAKTLELRQEMRGHAGPIYAVTFTPQGDRIVSVGWKGNVRLWETSTGAELSQLEGSQGDLWSVSFCADGTHLIAGQQDGLARVWDMRTRQVVATLRGHESAVYNVSLDPTAHRIATGSRDGSIRIWDMSAVAKNK